jgi:hypothetical protein
MRQRRGMMRRRDREHYARRATRDPEWHEAQLRGAAERDRQRRERDPGGYLAARRAAARRCRERQRGHCFRSAVTVAYCGRPVGR